MTRPTVTAAAAGLAALAMAVGLTTPAHAADDRVEAKAKAAAVTAAAPGDLDWYFAPLVNNQLGRTTVFQDLGSVFDVEFPLVCDVGGNGDVPSEWAGNTFTLRGAGAADAVVRFGTNDDFPLCGDWDGDGIDTPGVVRGNTFYLAGSNRDGGGTVRSFDFGREDDYPLVGDWWDIGVDTIALARGSRYYFASANFRGGGTVVASSFGREDDFPIGGDFLSANYDTLALQRGNSFYVSIDRPGRASLRTDNRVYRFGRDTDFPVSGSLESSRRTSLGLLRIEGP